MTDPLTNSAMADALKTLRESGARFNAAQRAPTGVIDSRSEESTDHAYTIDHPNQSTRSINDFVAAEVADMQPTAEPITKHDIEPHGMYWFRSAVGAPPVLKAHAWFYADVETTANQILATASSEYSRDTQLREQINQMAAALRDYIECRRAINQMAGDRKLKQEADDAAYQLCQAAKYYLDATERAQYKLQRGEPIDDNPQIERLRTLAADSMREGYAIIQAVLAASDTVPNIDFKMATRRVVDYSCRRLTEWFSKKHQNNENQARLSNSGAALDLTSFLRRIRAA